MMELEDMTDSKSVARNSVRVQVPLRAFPFGILKTKEIFIMGIQAKPMGKMRGHFQKMDNASLSARQKAVNANKEGKKSKKETN